MYTISLDGEQILKSHDLDYTMGSLAALLSLQDREMLSDVNVTTEGLESNVLKAYQILPLVDGFPAKELDAIAWSRTTPDKNSLWVRAWDDICRLYTFKDVSFINGFANVMRRFGENYLAYLVNCCYVGATRERQLISENPLFNNESEFLADLTVDHRSPNKVREPEPQNRNEFGENVFISENDRYL